MRVQTGMMDHFTGFGTQHPDPMFPDLKKSVHSFILTMTADGLVRLQWKEFMHSVEVFPRPDHALDGPANGQRLFNETSEMFITQSPELEAETLTAPSAWPEVKIHLEVRVICQAKLLTNYANASLKSWPLQT